MVNQEGSPRHHPLSRRTLQIYHSIHWLFSNLYRPPASRVHNVYTLAFLVEMLNLAVVLFGYWAFGVSPRPRARTAFQAAQLSTWLSWEPPPRRLGSWGCSVPPELGVGVVVSSLITRQTTGFLNSRGWSVSLPTPFLSLYLE